jgi:hypothetical protein
MYVIVSWKSNRGNGTSSSSISLILDPVRAHEVVGLGSHPIIESRFGTFTSDLLR